MKILALIDNFDAARPLVDHLRQISQEHSVVTGSWPIILSASLSGPSSSPLSSPLEDSNLILLIFDDGVDIEGLVRLRRMTKIPILLIAPVADEATLILLYRAGIDDHMFHPVSYALLDAKLQVWQRWVMRLASILYH